MSAVNMLSAYLSVGALAPHRCSRNATLTTRCTMSSGRQPSQRQIRTAEIARADVAPYVTEGLPSHVASLLSSQKVPRGEVAALVLALLKNKDVERLQLEMKVRERDALQQHVTRRYLQLKGLWNARGILELGEEAVVLPPLQPGAPKLSERVKIWTELMAQSATLQRCICAGTGWKAAWIPERMEAMYKQLSGHVHAPIMADDVITIAEGLLNREQMAALACVAQHFNIAYELEYVKEPAVLTP